MQTTNITAYILTALLLLTPVAAHGFWGNNEDTQSGLNLETGYDINTVTTVTGRVVALHAGDDLRSAQCELDQNGIHVVVVLGPQRYWAEHGIAIKIGDIVTVRGSRAQGKDGVVYVLVQKISDTSQDASVVVRDEAGRPAWAGKSVGHGGAMINRPSRVRQHSYGRMGR